jgi:hypothetical protein
MVTNSPKNILCHRLLNLLNPALLPSLRERARRTPFLVNGKRKMTLAIEIRIRHLTSNMLIGFYMMG